MHTTSAKWVDAAQTTILATIDGIEIFVPNDAANIHRQAIAKWEAEGNVIGAYVAPPAPPRTIAGAYFRSALKSMGEYDRVVAALTDPIDLELFSTATEFNESASDVNSVATALGIDLAAVFDGAEAIRAARQS